MIMKKFETLEQIQAEQETKRKEKEPSSTPVESKDGSCGHDGLIHMKADMTEWLA
jgi:hypothetical protein